MSILAPFPHHDYGPQKVFFSCPCSNNRLPVDAFCASGWTAADVSAVFLQFGQLNTATGAVQLMGNKIQANFDQYVWQKTLQLPSQNGTYVLKVWGVDGNGEDPTNGDVKTGLMADGNLGTDTCDNGAIIEAGRFLNFAIPWAVGPFTATYPDPTNAINFTCDVIESEYVFVGPPVQRYRFVPAHFQTFPPKNQSRMLPYVGPGLYTMKFVFIDQMENVWSYSQTKRVR